VVESVYSAVGTGSLNKGDYVSSLKGYFKLSLPNNGKIPSVYAAYFRVSSLTER